MSPRCGRGPFKGSEGGSAESARLSRDPALPARARPFRAAPFKMVGAGEAPPAPSGPIRRHPRPIRALPTAAALPGTRGFPGGRGMGFPRPAGAQRGGNGAEGRERPGRPAGLGGAAAFPCAGRGTRGRPALSPPIPRA